MRNSDINPPSRLGVKPTVLPAVSKTVMTRNRKNRRGWRRGHGSEGSAETGTVEANRLPRRTRRALGHEPESTDNGEVGHQKTDPASLSTIALFVALGTCVIAAVGLATIPMVT